GQLAVGNFFAAKVEREEDVVAIRAKAVALLKRLRESGEEEMPLGPLDRLPRSLGLAVGGELPEAEIDMWLEQTALDRWARGLKWHGPTPPAERADFTVGIVGTGLSGLNAMVHLKRAGVPFVAFEKNDEVGGTWYENRYPGARVDTPSRSYTHLFGVDFPYPFAFCPQEDNLRYFQWVADHFELRGDIHFETEITSMTWDEAAQEWELAANGKDGRQTWRVNAVISCVGFLSRPKLPEIAGMESFAGTAVHTAQWPKDLEVAGKRVAVIGSGASGYQTTPVIAKSAAETYLFQRTPSWCFDNPMYVRALPQQSLWLDRNFPYYVNFARFRLSWIYGPEGFRAAARIDPSFDDPHARSAVNKRTRDLRIAYLEKKLAGRPDLIEQMTPKAPPISSRPVIVDSQDSIYDALMNETVTLVSDPIER
ncbi:MAG: NAD(P)/FAD-dependent oxidoreductase, partial [Sphingomonadales bacterium]